MSEACDELPPPEHYGEDFYIEATENLYPAAKSDAEADFIARHLQLRRSQRLLDIPCGYGRLSRRLAPRVGALVGVDHSEENLRVARRQGEETGQGNLSFTRADMRTYTASQPFDAAVVAFTSFGLFDAEDNDRFLAALGACLTKKGRIYLDVLNRRHFMGTLPRVHHFATSGFEIRDHLSWLGGGRLRSIREYHSARGRHRSAIEVQTFDLEEISSLLCRHGFRTDRVFSSFADDPCDTAADKMMVFASRDLP